MLEKFLSLKKEHRLFAIMLIATLAGFLCLCPLFILSKGTYPMGWLAGGLLASLVYLDYVIKGEDYLSKIEDEKKAALIAGILYGIKAIILGAMLAVAAICTFVPEWFGGWNLLNFWTLLLGYLLLLIPILAETQFFGLRKKKDQ